MRGGTSKSAVIGEMDYLVKILSISFIYSILQMFSLMDPVHASLDVILSQT